MHQKYNWAIAGFSALAFLFSAKFIVESYQAYINNQQKQSYAQFILNHQYYQSVGISEKTKFEKKTATPEKAFQQDYLLTLDPATGKPEPSRLTAVLNQVNQKLAIGGIPPGSSASPWVERGPANVGGRTRALMYDPNDPLQQKVWAGGVTGGLWYNANIQSGLSVWQKVNDFWDNVSVTCIAYDPNNTQVFYVGTGEGFNTNSSKGGGIWKSIDGGANWSKLTSTNNFYYVNDIVVRNEGGVSTVYAAVDGQYYMGAFHGTAEAGLQQSTNGGSSWTQVLPNVPQESINFVPADLEIGSNNRLWVGTKESPYSANDGGGGRVLYSDDGTAFTTAYSSNASGRVEVACAPNDANYVYAIFEDFNEVFEIRRTINGGLTWNLLTEPNDDDLGIPSNDFSRGQAWYDLILAVDPNNKENVIAGAINLHRTTNGGSSWSQISKWSNNPNMGTKNYSYVHADMHAIVYKPGSSSEVIFGTDGGVFYTSNVGSASSANVISARNNGYNVTQFYSCAIHPVAATNYFLAGSQDNGTQIFISAGLNNTTEAYGGDGGFCFIDQTLPNYQIVSYVYNNYILSTNGGSSFSTDILTDDNTGWFINIADYDDNLHALYSAKGNNDLYRISNINSSFNVTSIPVSGMSARASAIKVSPFTTNSTTLFVGSSSGQLFKVQNANSSPTVNNITGFSFPAGSISSIEFGTNENEIMVTFSNYGVNSVWFTTNGGTSWASKEGNLPDMPVRWGMLNPQNIDEAILATEVGVWSTINFTDINPIWVSSNSGLANVRVDMLQMRQSDFEVIAATHGRGLFSSSGFSIAGTPTSPIANFGSSKRYLCVGETVQFTDSSTGVPASWQWFFNGGTPSSSTAQNPTVSYIIPGVYDVTLIVTNSFGSHTKTIQSHIVVGNNPVEVSINTDNFGSQTTWELLTNTGQVIYSGGPYPNLNGGGTYQEQICVPDNCFKFRINDSGLNGICCSFGTGSYSVKSVANNYVMLSGGNFTASDSGTFCLPITNLPPVADFTYSSASICVGDTVFFSDASFNTPTSWVWQFNGGNPSFSINKNPVVVYQTPGVYSVSLTVTNANGNDTKTVTNLITVSNGPVVTINTPPSLCDNFNANYSFSANRNDGVWIASWNARQDTAFINPASAGLGNYTLRYEVTETGGCVGFDEISFSVLPAPQVTLTLTDTICLNQGPYALSGGLPVGGIYSGYTVTNNSFNPNGIGTGLYSILYTYVAPNGCADSAEALLAVDVCAGIEKVNSYNNIDLFPNPVEQKAQITFHFNEEVNYYKIYNATGQVVKMAEVNDGVKSVNLDLGFLPRGTYYLILENNLKQVAVKRFVKI